MTEEDDLPPPSTAPPAPLFRNKSYNSTSGNSSDAPFFSSDDLAEASVENYVSPSSRKRQSKRRWWGTPFYDDHKKLPKSRKRAPDSGVFLASDSSSTDDGFSVEHIRTPKRIRQQRAVQSSTESTDIVLQTVNKCVEEGAETVDLSHLSLTEIANRSLQPLQYLIRRPKFDQSKDGVYHSLTPCLKIFLSSNRLTAVPTGVVSLKNLTVLSLRNNRIKELPSSIGKLQNLVEFNIAGNNLRWLPWELLGLVGKAGKLVNLNVFPNPLLKPTLAHKKGAPTYCFPSTLEAAKTRLDSMEEQESPFNTQSDIPSSWLRKLQRELYGRMQEIVSPKQDGLTMQKRSLLWKKDPVYLGSSQVALYELDGSWPRKSIQPPSSLPPDVIVLPPMNQESATMHKIRVSSGAPSLFELSLRSCSQQLILDEFDFNILPTTIQRALERARHINSEGGRTCSVCSREYIQPRAEWIEYWHCDPESLNCTYEEMFIPFLRQSCNWNCIDNQPTL